MEFKRGWVSIKESKPVYGSNIIAVGTYFGELGGEGENDYMGIGLFSDGDGSPFFGGDYVMIDTEGYFLAIKNITHWMPLPPHPQI